MRRVCVTAALLCLLATLLPGCAGTGEDGDSEQRVTLTFWHSLLATTQPALREMIARFEEEHPHIRIQPQYIPTGDALVQKLITAVQSNSAPDLSWVRSHYLEELAKADAVFKMQEFIGGPNGLTDEEMSDFFPALMQYASWRDTLYSMPMEATNLGLLYNKDHFREVGLDPERPPQTWEELREFSRRLAKDNNGDGRYERIGFMVPAFPADGPQGTYMMWQFLPFVWQAGGYMVNESSTRAIYDEEAGVQALTLWKDIYEAHNQRTFANEAIVAFASKQASMILDGPWNLTRYDQILGDIDYGIGMLPEGPQKRATIVAGEFLSIFKQTKHPQEAWEFVKYITRPDVQASWSMESGYLPVRASVMELEAYRAFLDENPNHGAYAKQMEYAQAQRPVHYFLIEIQRDLAQAIEQATVGGSDPERVLREAARASNLRLERAPVAALSLGGREKE